MLFNVPDNPKIAPSVEGSRTHLMHGFLGQPESAPKRHLDRFSRFCRAHERDHRPRIPSVAIGREANVILTHRCKL